MGVITKHRIRRLFASGSLIGLLFTGCGDADVCGAYNSGNVVIVDRCTTDDAQNPGDGSQVTNELSEH